MRHDAFVAFVASVQSSGDFLSSLFLGKTRECENISFLPISSSLAIFQWKESSY